MRRTIEIFFLKVVLFQLHERCFDRDSEPKRDEKYRHEVSERQQWLDCSLNGRRESIGDEQAKV
jgi:hypothetical protein